MSEAAKAVLRFTRREVGKALAVALGLGMLPQVADAFRPHFFSGGAVGSSPGTIATLTLINTSGTTQPAGQPTQTFGHVFNDGDIAPGTAPKFTIGGVSQPFSAGLQTYWPSGCLKFAAFMLLPTVSIAGNGSQTVTVLSGGTWPAASSRTLTEVYSQNLVLNAPPYSSSYNGRSSSTLGGWLRSDVNNVRQLVWLDGAAGKAWKITTNMSATIGGTADGMLLVDHYIMALNNSSGGLGGFRWLGAIRQPFWNQTGAANNSPGAFVFFNPPATSSPTTGLNFQTVGPGGSGTVTTPMPWLGNDGNTFDVASFSNGASFTGSVSGTTLTVASSGFSGFIPVANTIGGNTWLNGSGITVNTYSITNQLTGTAGGPGTYSLNTSPGTIAPQAMTCFNTQGFATAAANNYYMGGNSNTLPVVISGGALPTTSTTPSASFGAFANGGFAFLLTLNNDPNLFALYWSGSCSASQYNFTNMGTGTITPIPGLFPFNRLMFANSVGEYTFFQGTPTDGAAITAETTLMVQFSQSYFQSSGVIPPLNLTLQGASMPGGGVVTDVAFNYSWYPYTNGPMPNEEPQPGDHADIGTFTGWNTADFYNQSKNSLTITRICGLAGANILADLKDATTDTINSLGNPATTYTGLPGSSDITANWSFIVGAVNQAGGAGFVQPPSSPIGFNPSLPEHFPNFPTWPFIRTGELQYLDLMVDDSFTMQAQSGFRNPTPALAGILANRYAIVNWYNDAGAEQRSLAWAGRGVQWAAMLYPFDPSNTVGNPVFTDGTQLAQYLIDVADTNAEFPLDAWQNSGVYNSYIKGCGGYMPWASNSPAAPYLFGNNFTLWEFCDFLQHLCIAVARKGSSAAAAKTFIEQCGSARFNYIGSNFKGGSPNGFYLFYSEQLPLYALASSFDPSFPFAETLISSDAEFAVNANNAINIGTFGSTNITWAPNSSGGIYTGPPAFTFVGGFPNNLYTPANGDKFVSCNDFGAQVTELSLGTPFYLINVAPKAGSPGSYVADMSASIGGSPVLITSSTSGSNTMAPFFAPAIPPALGWPFSYDYTLNQWAVACWANALGVTGYGSVSNTNTILGDITNRLANTPGGPFPLYINAMGFIDTRYAMQPNFA